MTNAVLADLDRAFSALYEACVPPDRLLRASLLQLLYSIRSERQLVERIEFDPLFRWFVGLSINGTVSKNGKVRKIAVPPEVAASVGYAISQRLRKRIEEGFGWMKTVGGLAQVKARGLAKVRAVFVFGVAAYSLVRLPKLLAPIGDVCLDG